MTWNKIITMALLTFIISATTISCVTTRSTKKINQIELGMTKDEISQLFGKPIYRNASQEIEQWGYRKQVGEIAGPEPVLLVIDFDTNGRVTGFETVREFPRITHNH